MLFVPAPVAFTFQVHQTDAPSTTPGAAITPGTASKGSWTQLLANTAIAQDLHYLVVWITVGNTSAAVRNIVVDIGVDRAGGSSYTVLIPDILCSQAGNVVQGGCWYHFPVYVRAGSSMAARALSNSTSTVRVDVMGYGQPTVPTLWRAGSVVEAIGVSGATGTSVTAGNTGAEGSWTSLGTTSNTLWWWQLGAGFNNSTTTSQVYHIDLAYGTATNKVMIIQNQKVILPGTAEQTNILPALVCAREVPAGSTIYARASASGTASTGLGVTAYGVG